MRARPVARGEHTSRTPTVCRTATTVEFHSDRAKGTDEFSTRSPTLPHWRSVGKNVQFSPVISASVDRALRTSRWKGTRKRNAATPVTT
jgi:hypothetical protein